MKRFGSTQIYHPDIRDNKLAKVFLKVFGTVDTGSSHLHFQRIVKKLSFTTVLDAGCGKGKYSFYIAQKYPTVTIDALDLSDNSIEFCKGVKKRLGLGNIHFLWGDLIRYKMLNKYDFIFSNHVLEHIKENLRVISNLVLSLRTGGYILTLSH